MTAADRKNEIHFRIEPGLFKIGDPLRDSRGEIADGGGAADMRPDPDVFDFLAEPGDSGVETFRGQRSRRRDDRDRSAIRWEYHCGPLFDQRTMSSSSTSKISVALGGMVGGAPCSP